MIDTCPFCHEPMSYRGHFTVHDPDGEPLDIHTNDSYCLHCGYAFGDDERDLIDLGEYAFGDPYQLRAALEKGQMALL